MFSSPTPAGRKAPILSLKPNFANKHQLARVIVAVNPSTLRRPISSAFWEAGWNVHLAKTPGELRRMVRKEQPHAVALLAQPAGQESGWLTCRKLTLDLPKLKVILLSDRPTERDRRLAKFVGAADCLPVSEPWRAIQAASTGMRVHSH